MKELLTFLKSQKLVAIASRDTNDVWVANAYYGIDDDFKIYFVSPENAKHSQYILKNPGVAFSVAWFDAANHGNRKAIQGSGMCRLAKNEEEIIKGVQLHNQNFPEFAKTITVDWIHTNEHKSRIWIIEPIYIKHWSDERYGDKETEEFFFNKK